jgi:hypothetical protein
MTFCRRRVAVLRCSEGSLFKPSMVGAIELDHLPTIRPPLPQKWSYILLDGALAEFDWYKHHYPDDCPDPHFLLDWGLALFLARRFEERRLSPEFFTRLKEHTAVYHETPKGRVS